MSSPAATPEAVPAAALQKLLTDVDAETLTRFDGDNKWYHYAPLGQEFISVTTVLSATHAKPYLVPWGAKSGAVYAAHNLDGLAYLRDNGTSLTGIIGAITAEAKRRREMASEAGKFAHKVIQALCLWSARGGAGDIPLPDLPDELADADMDGITLREFTTACVDGWLNFMSDFHVEIEMSEGAVFHPEMRYAGTVDSILHLTRHRVPYSGADDGIRHRPSAPDLGKTRPMRLMVDWKTGKKIDVTVRGQLAAYRRAKWVQIDQMGTMVPVPQVDGVAVLHLRPLDEMPRGYQLRVLTPGEDARGWNMFREALNLYNEHESGGKTVGTVWSPLGADGIPLPMLLGDLEGYGAGISSLLKNSPCTTIADVAAMTREQCLAVKGVGEKTILGIEQALADNGLTFADATEEAVA